MLLNIYLNNPYFIPFINIQMSIPEDKRPFPTTRNPYSCKQLWRSQDDLEQSEQINTKIGIQPTLNTIFISRRISKKAKSGSDNLYD